MGSSIIEGDGSSDAAEPEQKVRRLIGNVGARVTQVEGCDGERQVEVPGLSDDDLREMWNEIDVVAT